MNKIFYNNRCRCSEKFLVTKKRQSTIIISSEGKPLQYPKSNEIILKTFKIRYEKNLSSTAKLVLNSFHNKYIYYAMDDILYSFKSNLFERNNLLTILYSPLVSLQNNFSVNFFDIWINEIYIRETPTTNKFISNNLKSSKKINLITIKFFYKNRLRLKKQKFLW